MTDITRKYQALIPDTLGQGFEAVQFQIEQLMHTSSMEDVHHVLGGLSQKWEAPFIGFMQPDQYQPLELINVTDRRMDGHFDEYVSNGFHRKDPVVASAPEQRFPVPWGFSEHRLNMGSDEAEVYEFLADKNIRHGLLIPLHFQRFSVMGIALEESEAVLNKRLAGIANEAHLVSSFVYQALQQLNRQEDDGVQTNLTPKELDCVYYLSQGDAASDIAKKLNVSSRTVYFHFDNAKQKLGCRSLHQLVARAVMHGLICP